MTAKKLFQIKCWWNDKVLFEGQYVSQKECVEDAVKNGARLNGARLNGARLDGARLDGARLDGARLDGARLDGARLDGARLNGARLDGARLDGARLDGASLDGASLNGASLDGARLDGARLDGARLDGARLDGARLDGARLDGASLDGFKQDLIAEILKLPDELENLRDTIITGKIDGSTYQGECACLAGTIAKHRGISDIMGEAGGKIQENGCVFKADPSSPREVWFMAIRPGQTPENHQPAKLALDWINEAIAIRNHIRKGSGV